MITSNHVFRKIHVCGVRVLAALIVFACVLMSFAEPVKVGNPGFPYSVPGSFLTVCRCEKGKYMFNTYPGLWIRNVSTCWRENFCRLVPSVGGTDVEVTECVMREGWLEAKTEKGAIEFAYLRPDVVLVRAKRMLDATVKILFDEDGAPRVRRLRDGGFDRDSLSLVTRLPMILGKRLPEKCRAKMIDDIKTKGFITDWGLASESVNSKHYHPDGYWKGPIWGPSTLIAVEGLRACGEDALADEISLKFGKLIMKSGFSENFDAKTGDARRDPAYTWTASAFLVLAHELQKK